MVFSSHLKSSRFQHKKPSEGKSEGECVSDKFQSSQMKCLMKPHELVFMLIKAWASLFQPVRSKNTRVT